MTLRVPLHVFISFANAEAGTARALAERLAEGDVAVWIAPQDLVPGTPDWETAIRAAIADSFAVVLLASPCSSRSRFVRGELGIAEARRIPIIPVWVSGVEWPESVPLGLQYVQYVDIRGERYQAGTAELIKRLHDVIAKALPSHFRVDVSTTTDARGVNTIRLPIPPTGFIRIRLHAHAADYSAVMFRVAPYRCNGDLLDALFVNYLGERFEPFTYGRQWVLIEESIPPLRVFVPFAWLAEMDGVWSAGLESWLSERLSLSGNSQWSVCKTPINAYGVAVKNPMIPDALARPKRAYGLVQRGILRAVPYRQVAVAEFPITEVRVGSTEWFGKEPERGEVLCQTDIAISDHDYLLRGW